MLGNGGDPETGGRTDRGGQFNRRQADGIHEDFGGGTYEHDSLKTHPFLLGKEVLMDLGLNVRFKLAVRGQGEEEEAAK
ncbi:hypothetical protein GCM10027275_54680 [Rhabdobacter roseus]